MEKRRICCFCETWESGGIESFLNNVFRHMDLTGLEVDIVAACLKDSVFTAGLEEKGIRFFELSGNLRALPKNHSMFRALLRERHYDVVHLNLYQGLALYYVRIAEEEGVPVRIAHSHNTDLRRSLFRPVKLALHGWGRRRFASCATERWACSAAAADFLFGAGARFIPNGIETERFAFRQERREAVRRELGLANDLVIGHVGRLCYQKNQSFLLDVFAELLTRRPDSRLLLVGAGEDESNLRQKAEGLGIAERVIFYGVTDGVQDLFFAMDVFAFPSLFEGLGIVAVEAQAAGLPVVASEHVPAEAAVTELLRYCSLNSADCWADTLLEAAKLQNDRIGAADAVRRAGFDIADVARDIWESWRRENGESTDRICL